VVAATLGEMNPEVVTNSYAPSTSLSTFITGGGLAEFIKEGGQKGSLVYPPPKWPLPSGATSTILLISNDLEPNDNVALSKMAIDLGLPLVILRTYGLIGTVRIQSADGVHFTTLEPRPDAVQWDLRLPSTPAAAAAFPGLKAYTDDRIAKMDAMDDQQHGHIPYPVILVKALALYAEKYSKPLPETFAEKDDFKAIVKGMSRDFNMEANFMEAFDNAYRGYVSSAAVPGEVADLLEMDETKNLTADSKPFFLLLSSLADYVKSCGDVPLNGAIPDMTASTDEYIALQEIYQAKSVSDLATFSKCVQVTLSSVGLPSTAVPDAVIACFVKNIPYLRVIPSLPYHESLAPSEASTESVQEATWDPYETYEHSPFIWFLGMRAAEKYNMDVGEWPGKYYDMEGRSRDEEVEKLCGILEEVVALYGLKIEDNLTQDLLAKVATELCRLNNSENHNIASIVGGMASQEAVKMLTGQYIPLSNTFLFNGIAGVGGAFFA
jgi:amyloid beta precursor protein binding protein 1